MRATPWTKLMTAVLAVSLLLTGCTGKAGKPASEKPAVGAKLPLEVPKTFESEAAKQDFAAKAINDGYFTEAKSLLAQSLAAEPSAKGYKALGTAQYNLSDYNGAVEAWSKAAEIEPKLAAEMQNNIGNVMRDTKKYAEAEAAYRKASELDPKLWAAATNLATLLNVQGKRTEAITVLEQAVENNKDVEPLTALLNSLKVAEPKNAG